MSSSRNTTKYPETIPNNTVAIVFSKLLLLLHLVRIIAVKIRITPNNSLRHSLRKNVQSKALNAIGHSALAMLLPVISRNIGLTMDTKSPERNKNTIFRLDGISMPYTTYSNIRKKS